MSCRFRISQFRSWMFDHISANLPWWIVRAGLVKAFAHASTGKYAETEASRITLFQAMEVIPR